MYLALLTTLGILLILNNLPSNVISGCSTSNCGDSVHNPDIRFPFKVTSSNQPSTCGYPGFDVWCDQGSERTLIELPSSGNFSVNSIDYTAQELWVNDLNNCLPKKLLSLNLSNSPFSMVYYQEFSFYNCSSTLVTKNKTAINFNVSIIGPITCLSGLNYFIYAIPLSKNNISSNITIATIFSPSKCYLVAQMVKVPVQWPPLSDNEMGLSSISKLDEDLRLSWFMPECQSCELHGQMCAIETNSSRFEVITCSKTTNHDTPRKLSLTKVTTMIAVILVICSPSIICMVGSLYIWIRTYLRQSPVQTSFELGSIVTSTAQPRQVANLGLTNETSPQYVPTIELSEIQEMDPNVSREGENENICAICMVEYHAKDKMGTLPICGHYFHASCINEWLLSRGVLERTCPICRARVG